MIELISKDKNEKLQFVGRCKLTIDSLSNLLLIEPFNEEHKMISALFEWQFVAQKNILFVFAEYSFQDFALIFENAEKCNKVWGILLKKGAIFGNNELIHERFLPELFKQILENNDFKMKTIFADWFKLHEKQEKEKCIQLLKNYNIYDDMMKFMNEKNNQKNSRKRKAAELNETKKVVASRENFAALSDFKVFTYKHNGKKLSKLIIYCETNKNLCYEYYFNKILKKYICSYCPMEKLVTAIVRSKNDNSKEYLKLSSEKHVCELREFDQDKYKNDIVITKSMYEITSIFTKEDSLQKSLTIFINDEKKYYYKFFYNKLGKLFYCSKCLLLKFPLTAVIHNHGKEKKCVYMSHQKHICDPLKYFGLTNGNLIQTPKYQLIKRKNRGKIFQHLVVFTNDERSECFEYTLNEIKNNFVCYACNNRHKWFVCAKIVYNAAEEECLQLSERLHKCKPIKFVPENISTKLIKLPNYQLLIRKANGKMFQHLAVFTNDEKNECFEYTWNESEKKFVCNSCRCHKIHVTAKIIKMMKAKTV